MPDLTIASAISRTITSLTWLRNLFQLFQPIGGVLARPFDFTVSVGIGSFSRGPRVGRGGKVFDSRANSMICGPPRPPPGPPGPNPVGGPPAGGPPVPGAPGAPPGPGPRPGPRPPPNAG